MTDTGGDKGFTVSTFEFNKYQVVFDTSKKEMLNPQ